MQIPPKPFLQVSLHICQFKPEPAVFPHLKYSPITVIGFRSFSKSEHICNRPRIDFVVVRNSDIHRSKSTDLRWIVDLYIVIFGQFTV